MANEIPKIDARTREKVGSRYAARLREAGELPAVIYGHKETPATVAIDAKRFREMIDDTAHLIEVNVDGRTEHCLIKDVQWDHLGVKIVHADLARVDVSEEVEVELEVELVGEPAALNEEGAVLSQPTTSVTVACRADAIPDSLQADISEMELNGTLMLQDVKLPAGLKPVSDPETVIATIQVVYEEPEEEAAEAPAEGEPEVLSKREEGDEGESGQ